MWMWIDHKPYTPPITPRVVTRYYVNGKGYASKWEACRAIAKRQLKNECENEAKSCEWFNEDYNADTDSMIGKRAVGACLVFRKRYANRLSWTTAVHKRAREIMDGGTK